MGCTSTSRLDIYLKNCSVCRNLLRETGKRNNLIAALKTYGLSVPESLVIGTCIGIIGHWYFLLKYSKSCQTSSSHAKFSFSIWHSVTLLPTDSYKFDCHRALRYLQSFRESLMAQNWQKWKIGFLICHCHKYL